MSALPPKADISRTRFDVRYVPKVELDSPLDQLVENAITPPLRDARPFP